MALSQSGWPRSPCLSLGARACRLPHLRHAALTLRTRLLGLARRAPQPGNHRQSRWPLRKLADRRQGSALASVRSPDPGASRPGHSTAEVVGHLASLPEASRRQSRLAAGCLTGTLTAGQCFSLARLRDPDKWLVPHHLSGTLRPAPVRQTRSVRDRSLTLRCTAHGYTGSNIKADSPAPPSSVPLQTLPTPDRPRLAQWDGRPSLPVRLAGQADRIV